MIITCPACATRYELPDGAIGAEGRIVRCANCRHSWMQSADDGADEDARVDDGDVAPQPEARPVAPPQPAPPQSAQPQSAPPQSAPPQPAPPPADDPASAARVDRPASASAYASPALSPAPAPVSVPASSAFGYEPPFVPRQRRRTTWLVASVLILLVVAGIVFAALRWYGVPDWLPFAQAKVARTEPGLVLDFPVARMDRRTLADGTEYFGASGTVTNTGAARRKVPPIEIVMRDSHRQVVYRWEVTPPRRQLAPGESMTISQAVTDIPRSAIAPEIGWKAT